MLWYNKGHIQNVPFLPQVMSHSFQILPSFLLTPFSSLDHLSHCLRSPNVQSPEPLTYWGSKTLASQTSCPYSPLQSIWKVSLLLYPNILRDPLLWCYPTSLISHSIQHLHLDMFVFGHPYFWMMLLSHQLHLGLVIWLVFSPHYHPSTNIPLFEQCNVLLSLVINNSPMNRFPISNSTYVQIFCVKYIPLLCQIWPSFVQKSSFFYQRSLAMIQTCVPIFLKSLYSLDDKIRTTVQLITWTVLQNCPSLFTIHYNSQFTSNTKSLSLVDFLYESGHLSKIRLGASALG